MTCEERMVHEGYRQKIAHLETKLKRLEAENAELRAFKETLKNHLPQCKGGHDS